MNDKSLSIKEQNVSSLQKKFISSFLQPWVDQCENCDVDVDLIININPSFVWMWKKTMYDSLGILTLIGSKASLFNNSPCDQWMVVAIANWIGNWILVIIWDWFLPIPMSLIIGSWLVSNLIEYYLCKGELIFL